MATVAVFFEAVSLHSYTLSLIQSALAHSLFSLGCNWKKATVSPYLEPQQRRFTWSRNVSFVLQSGLLLHL